MEAFSKTRDSDEIQGSKRKTVESEARAKAKAEMWEKAENTRKAREPKAKAEPETVERVRAWYEAKAKDKEKISKVNADIRERGKPRQECGKKPMLFRGQQQRLPP